MALDEYYKDAPELIDTLIENWQGGHDKVEDYKNLLDGKDFDTAVDYLNELKKICKDGYDLLDSSELKSDMDSILSLIDRTVYKLKELTEKKMNLVDYLKSINESRTSWATMTEYAESWTNSCWDDKELTTLFKSMTNGVYRALSERAVASWAGDDEKKIANKWMDKIEEMLKIIDKK